MAINNGSTGNGNTDHTAPVDTNVVGLPGALFDQAFEPVFGPATDEMFTDADRQRMTSEFAANFPHLNGLLESARLSA